MHAQVLKWNKGSVKPLSILYLGRFKADQNGENTLRLGDAFKDWASTAIAYKMQNTTELSS
jgi:hypothetical protein